MPQPLTRGLTLDAIQRLLDGHHDVMEDPAPLDQLNTLQPQEGTEMPATTEAEKYIEIEERFGITHAEWLDLSHMPTDKRKELHSTERGAEITALLGELMRAPLPRNMRLGVGPEITERNAPHFYARLRLRELVFGPDYTDSSSVRWDAYMIHDRIGLRVNAPEYRPLPWQGYVSRLLGNYESQQRRIYRNWARDEGWMH